MAMCKDIVLTLVNIEILPDLSLMTNRTLYIEWLLIVHISCG